MRDKLDVASSGKESCTKERIIPNASRNSQHDDENFKPLQADYICCECAEARWG